MITTSKWLASAALATLTATTGLAQDYKMQPVALQTRWAKEVSPQNALKDYPRPQLVRKNWQNLNGLWAYAIAPQTADMPQSFDGQILVPFPVESALSGVKKPLLSNQLLWYKRTLARPLLRSGEHVLLHFGAVDWQTTVFINGIQVGMHTGGYSAFTFDITAALKEGNNELLVKVYDPTDTGIGPHGKQVSNPANIYYTATSGIWQTVWMEVVPVSFIENLIITPDIDKSIVNIVVKSKANIRVKILLQGAAYSGTSNTNIGVSVKNMKLWSPANPYLYNFSAIAGKDTIQSYFGMRKISVAKDDKGVDRIMLNNQVYYNLGTLDQGFWPEGLYTAPTDEALAFDIKAIKAMGFNTIRKHIKVEPARWYYYTDKLGMLVWQDLVNPNQGLPVGSKPEFERESADELAQLHNYPSIVTWVLFNERWGQYDQKRLTNWVKHADPSRLLNGHSGELLYVNEVLRSPSIDPYVDADITDVHAYPDPMMPIRESGKAQVCGEFGGIGVFIPDHQWLTGAAWGYITEKPAALMAKYSIMNQHLRLFEQKGLSGSIYTQPFDVEGEQNGLMTYDREIIKIPFAELRRIHASLNPNIGPIPDIAAKNADLTEPGITYITLLTEYIQGKRDPAFLKKMAIMATQTGDKPGSAMATADYIQTIQLPLSQEDLEFIKNSTNSTKDAGFDLMQKNEGAFKKSMGDRPYAVAMMNMIWKSELELLLSKNPDWNAIKNVSQMYGAPGEELFLRAKTIHHMNNQDWPNYLLTARVYLEKYGVFISQEERKMLEDNIKAHQ